MIETTTDCRTEEGVTVGLLDAVIPIFRILRGRDLSSKAAQEAIKDLRADEDVAFVLSQSYNNMESEFDALEFESSPVDIVGRLVSTLYDFMQVYATVSWRNHEEEVIELLSSELNSFITMRYVMEKMNELLKVTEDCV